MFVVYIGLYKYVYIYIEFNGYKRNIKAKGAAPLAPRKI